MAIPTTYKDIRFRSMLEARWAAFMDMIGWGDLWRYEPCELVGYIPDFILDFRRPLLMEVKPAHDSGALEEHKKKIVDSGWRDDIMIVGAYPFRSAFHPGGLSLGLLSQPAPDGGPPGERCWASAEIGICNGCREWSVMHSEASYECYRCGHYDGGGTFTLGTLCAIEIDRFWNRAGNGTQWWRWCDIPYPSD